MFSRLSFTRNLSLILFAIFFSTNYSYGGKAQVLTQTVDLISFIGKQESCDVNLIWTSSSEENFSHYQLEKSINGVDFEAIKTINGAGGDFTQRYNHLDQSASIGYNYYRLKMVNLDESFSYTRAIEVTNSCGDLQSNDVMVYPNPITVGGQMVSFKFFANTEANTVIVTDGLGSVIQEIELDVTRGWNTIAIDTKKFARGMYTVSQFDSVAKAKSRKLIIID